MKKNNDLSRAVWTQSPPACLRRRSYALMRLILLICLLVMTQESRADNFLQNPANYTAYVQGIDVVRFTLPTQMWSSFLNEGITKGHVKVSVDDGPMRMLIEWDAGANYRDIDGKYSTTCRIKGHEGGSFKLTGKTEGGEKAFKSDADWTTYRVICNDDDDDHYTTVVDWTVPRTLRGHKLVFYLWCHSEDRDYSYYIPKGNKNETEYYKMAEWNCPAAPEASVQLSEPMLAFDPDHVNSIMFTYTFTAQKVKWAKLHYTDALTNEEKVMDVNGGALVDILYLPADRPYSSIQMEASVVDSEGNTVADPVKSDPVSSFMLHHPVNLTFAPTAEGNIQLTWGVNNAKDDDIIEGDCFEVQRNLTGSTDPEDANWATISTEKKMEKGIDTYSIIDDSFLQMNKGVPVSYRVRRLYTSMWQWKAGAGHVEGTLPWTFVLPYSENATVHKTDIWNDEQHVVEVAFTDKSTDYEQGGNYIVRNEEDESTFNQLVKEGKLKTDQVTYLVSTTKDWERACDKVNSTDGKDFKIVLMSDLELSNSEPRLGSNSWNRFKGILEGNGHTIHLDYSFSSNYGALIHYAGSCKVQNLTVTGKVSSSRQFAGGLIGQIDDHANVEINNVDVDIEFNLTENGDASSGGFVGIMEKNSFIVMQNCAFHGSIVSTQSHSNGGFIGVALQNTTVNIINCLFAPTTLPNKTDGCRTFVRADNSASVMVENSYYTKTYGANNGGTNAANITSENLLEKLGKEKWSASNNGVYPKLSPTTDNFFQYGVWDPRAKMQLRINMHGEKGVETRYVDLSENKDALIGHQFTQELSRKCVEYSFDLLIIRDASPLKIAFYDKDTLVVPVTKLEQGDLANYRFVNSNKITELTHVQKQSSVELHWKTSGGDHDFFRIMRKEEGSSKDWEEIATNLEQMSYEDKGVLAQHNYEYRVESVWQCEGTNIESATCIAGCATTGMITGYVRMADGTAIAGQVVECRPQGNISGASALYTQVTSETGYYEFSKLPYQGSGTYEITVPVPGTGGKYTGPNASGTVNFSESSNWTQNFNYYMDTYYIYSGNVYYRNTSIPVPGVSFMLDGKEMHDASKNVITTNTQGAFSLSVPAGAHSVQAVKDGHFFAADGFLINEDAREGESKTLYNFKKNVSGAVIWDSTKVVLRGRVIGGDIQGNKPLGEGLTKNNLGDSLKIVMQLEGDNASYLILDPKDETVKSANYDVAFGPNKKNVTHVNVTRHTLTVSPDATTGEYLLELPPAKYKVIEVSAQGYASLFQAGKVGETVDLSFNMKGDTCVYNRIYHAVPNLEVTQFNPGNQPYYGVKTTTASDILGNNAEVNLWGYKHISENDSIPMYSFGYPVFMANSPYAWMLQACEKYYWNNDIHKEVDIVNLKGGEVTIKNYMVDSDDSKLSKTVPLDETGFGSYVFTPGNANFNLTDEMALRSVDITLEFDGSYYDIKPLDGKILKGYVMATKAKTDGTTTVAAGMPVLVDILRDPPGSGSSSYIEAGSKLSYSYSPTFEGSIGVAMSTKNGTYTTMYKGVVVTPAGAGSGSEGGTINEAHSDKTFAFTLSSTFNGSWTTSYNFDVTERIQTKSGQKWIGGKADLFMGTNEQLIMQDAIAVRAIPEDQYLLMKSNEGGSFKQTDSEGNTATIKVPIGTMRLIAKGEDAEGKTVYLVRDEVMTLGTRVKSTFIHSQHYIENELLPTLVKLRNDLIQVKDVDGQALADQLKEVVYVSTVDVGDPWFGSDDKVVMYIPANWSDSQREHAVNQVMSYNQEMGYWINMLARNEEEKINVIPSNLVKNYDIDGGVASLQYSESFSAGTNKSGFVKWPGVDNASIAKLFPSWALGAINSLVKKGYDTTAGTKIGNDGNNSKYLSVGTPSSGIKIKFDPILEFKFNDKSGKNESKSKKIGFTLSMASKSSLNVDVYRTVSGKYGIKSDTPDPFLKLTTETLKELAYGQPYHPDSNIDVYSSFVFRTRGGVTCQPYEGERKTKWYQPATVIDVATIPADKPRIWIEEPVVSNVPFDEPARYVLHMANETDYPERATLIFSYNLDAASNPNGAKVCVDGKVLGPGGESIVLYPAVDSKGKHTVFTKELTVYPSKAFDYEDLAISLKDPEDAGRVFTQKFSAHFIPTAGKVNISVPSDKWVINTESPYDGKRQQWYMPVRIDGFDINWPNFDHVELQYKLSTQGDKDWVNVCSYYADPELRSKASGVTDTIPSNGTILAPFYGEADPIEQYYDIRAVTYCRYAGGYLTGSSEVLTGIKDTRLPIAFGTPEPTDGILGIGDDIKIQFSEPIAANYLRNINNFEVLGTLNSNDISTSTSLSFDEGSVAVTQGSRNLSGKPFTVDMMINPATDKRDMTIFLHGGEDKGLRYGITADRRLMAVVNGQTVTSDSPVLFNNDLHEVAYVLDQTDDGIILKFFDGSKEIGSKMISGAYEASSPIILGFDPYDTDRSFKGDMLELRLWNRAMTSNQLDNYGKKKLTGFESGLLDYYPMNEGEGEWCYDKAAGSMDFTTLGTSWKRPSGISLTMKGDKGLRMSPDKFLRTTDHDYTLMFWFQTTDDTSTIFSNGEALRGQDDQINIGVENNELYVRSSGFEKKEIGFVSDGGWHHFAMTVSRSQNVANIYLDKKLCESFAADSLSGISSDHIALGATYKDKNTVVNPMKGHIDEVGMFSSVLPTNLIKEYSNHTPIGTMSALMAYLDFGRSQKMDNNTQHLEPTGISIKRYVDNQGKMLARRDTLVAQADVEALAARDSYAPMVSTAQMDNLNYSFAANNNELYINVTEPDFMVEKTNIYVTVKDVPDLQGNLMASPITMNLYVYRTPLRWDVKRIEKDLNYGSGMTYTATIKNLSGTTQHFSLDDLPIWITASQTQGTINALDEQKITFTVSDYINIGTYNEQVTLICDNGMAETLPMTLRVRGDEPEWSVSDELKQQNQTMMMVARVKIDGIVANSTEDILAVFDENQQVLGKAHIEVNNKAAANEALAYLTIYGYTKKGESPKLYFRFFQAASGSVYSVHPTDSSSIFFQKDAIVGSASQPVNLENSFDFVQTMKLKKGWNWVSFNVRPKRYYNEDGEFIGNVTVGDFLNGMSKWEVGDRIRSVNGTDVQQYTCREDLTSANGYRWEDEDKPVNIDNRQMYSIYSMSDKTVYLEGTYLYEEITVHKDWNRIGYLATINLPIAQALSDYTDDASEGDVVKSQSEFAIATKISSGSSSNIVWKGSLQFMEAGKGYMLKRKADSEVKFAYPLYYSDNRYSSTEETQYAPRRCSVNTLNTMNIVAAVDGIETEEGDRLVVFSGVERVAEAEADNEQNYYLNIGSDSKDNEPLTFAIERDGETIAMTSSRISYVPNQVLGTPNEPTAINFTSLEEMPHDGKWYTVSGIMMEKKPTTSGLYIYNGQVVFIK